MGIIPGDFLALLMIIVPQLRAFLPMPNPLRVERIDLPAFVWSHRYDPRAKEPPARRRVGLAVCKVGHPFLNVASSLLKEWKDGSKERSVFPLLPN